jgi:fructan beta-fructosidase
MKKYVLLLALAWAATPALAQTETPQWRPAYHFSPPRHWINDPNGLVYHRGEWHLFYQHNPYENKWGHMSWGHAVSKNLLSWEHLPVAIAEDTVARNRYSIFSGSAVYDARNTSGLVPRGGLVAIYTADYPNTLQNQHLAFSTDRGRTFSKYSGNPVLDIKRKDFRDPNVIWHAPSSQWVMSVVIPDQFKVQFYGSKNLKDWSLLSEFSRTDRLKQLIWECPALVEVPVEGSKERQWVLLISSNGPDATFTGMQYFVGTFDGTTFRSDDAGRPPRYVDYGKDFYAAIPWHDAPGGRKVLLGWMTAWPYAGELPTFPWKGQMSLPRELSVRKTGTGTELIQRPAAEVTKAFKLLRDRADFNVSNTTLPFFRPETNAYRLTMEVEPGTATAFGLKLAQDGKGQETLVRYDVAAGTLAIDRRKAGSREVKANFPSVDAGPLVPENGRIKLDVFVDNSSVEVFANDGRLTLTSLIFPDPGSTGISLFSEGGAARVRLVEIRAFEK